MKPVIKIVTHSKAAMVSLMRQTMQKNNPLATTCKPRFRIQKKVTSSLYM